MKKIVLVATMICLTGIVSGAFAQQKPSEEERRARLEKINAEREEFISKAMNLTDEEKKVFWPLCNELQMKKFELNRNLREEMRKINRTRRDKQPVSEVEYKKILELGSQVKVQEAKLEQEYLAKFLQVIPAEKVFLYRQSEQNFGERMIRERTQRLSHNTREGAEKAKQAQKERMQVQKEKQKERTRLNAERIKAQSAQEQQRRYRGM